MSMAASLAMNPASASRSQRPQAPSAAALVTAVCEFGDPLDPRSWSGTPEKVCKALAAQHALGHTISADVPVGRLPRKLAKLASLLWYGGSYQHERGKIFRHLRARHTERSLTAGDTDVLHFGAGHLPLAQLGDGRRHYLLLDTTFNLWSGRSTQQGRWKPRLARDADACEGQAYRQMTHIFTIGQYVQQNLIEHYGVDPARLSSVGTGRGWIEPFTGSKRTDEVTVLFVAKARFADKGGDLVLDAFKLAQQDCPNLRLHIVGQESYKDQLPKLPGLSVHGHIAKEELQRLFHESTLFAMPSRNEPWGLVYLEAMACGLPVVGLNRNSIPELTNHGAHGFCIDDPTPTAIAEVFRQAARDPQRVVAMGQTAQKFVLDNYSWEQTAQRILAGIAQARARGG